MTQKVERSCSIVDVPVLVRVNHGHLDPAYRVETSAESREKFSITLAVSWLEEEVKDFEHLFNYANLYSLLQSKEDSVLIGPIEEFVDEIDRSLQAVAKKQKITVSSTYIRVIRPDLLHGHVKIEKRTEF